MLLAYLINYSLLRPHILHILFTCVIIIRNIAISAQYDIDYGRGISETDPMSHLHQKSRRGSSQFGGMPNGYNPSMFGDAPAGESGKVRIRRGKKNYLI